MECGRIDHISVPSAGVLSVAQVVVIRWNGVEVWLRLGWCPSSGGDRVSGCNCMEIWLGGSLRFMHWDITFILTYGSIFKCFTKYVLVGSGCVFLFPCLFAAALLVCFFLFFLVFSY